MARTAVILLAVCWGLAPAAKDEPPRKIAVSGTAEKMVAPDICYLSFGVETFHKKSASEAYRQNNALMAAVSAGVKGLGIEAKDIQTTNFSIAPQYRYEDDSRRRIFDGYSVYHALNVNLRDLKRVSDVIDAAVNAGATEVRQVSFAVENPKQHTADVRLEAVRVAQAKAKSIAEVLGVKLGKPVSVSETEPDYWGRHYAQANIMMETSRSGAGQDVLEPGEFRLSRTVHVTFEIE
uniref:DUF541 domain-containing protein n=1 Tax=candidate division WOR-3 bacterium TaxID=2052148 RepID=A0A7C4G9P7_UNCW3